MFRKIASLAVSGSVLLLMQFAGCDAMPRGQESMQCCRHMPCNPANQAHDCCKRMVSAQAPTATPAVHVPLVAPHAIAVGWPPFAAAERATAIAGPAIDPPQHSPPRLYLVYASLLV